MTPSLSHHGLCDICSAQCLPQPWLNDPWGTTWAPWHRLTLLPVTVSPWHAQFILWKSSPGRRFWFPKLQTGSIWWGMTGWALVKHYVIALIKMRKFSNIALCSMVLHRRCFFFFFNKLNWRPSTSKKITTYFITVPTSLEWSGTKPALSLRYAWSSFSHNNNSV